MSEQHETEDTISDVDSWSSGVDIKEGTRIHRYQILGLLGKGGMGAVYKAYDPELDRSIAIKILTVKPQEGETASQPQARLMREAQALAKLSHPNVVSVFDVGTYEEGVYIAMEFVKGKTLREWLKDQHQTLCGAADKTAGTREPATLRCAARKPNRNEIIKTISKAGQGLHAAHTEGIVHRDFKPENVIIGDRGQVKVLDFGLARAAGKEDSVVSRHESKPAEDAAYGEKLLSKPLTKVGAIIGTTVYMAPEHFNFQELDEKTDQFSFCVTLFEALYGKRPFVGNSSKELKESITNGRIEIPRNADVPKWIEEIILKGISISKDKRHASMFELLNALDDDPEIARIKRQRKYFLMSSFVASAILFLGVGYLLFNRSNDLCTGASEKIANTWNQRVKQSINVAFLATGVSYAKDTLHRVNKIIDNYTNEWSKHYTQACEATHVKGDQSYEVLDLRMGCLKKRLSEVKALLNIFAEADSGVVQRAVQASSSLEAIRICGDEKALRAPYLPPKSKETRAKVAAIRESLIGVVALEKTGKYQEGLQLAKKIQRQSDVLDYQPVQAEALYWLGILLGRAGEYQESETILHDSIRLAAKTRDASLVAEALTALVWVVGFRQSRFNEGLSLAQQASVMFDVAGSDDSDQATLLNSMGVVFRNKGENDKALEYYQKSLAIYEKTLSFEHPHVATTLANIGIVFNNKGENDKALEYYQKSLAIREKTLGPQHPNVATTLNNMGIVFNDKGENDKALEYYQTSLAIYEKTLGPEHPNVANSLNNIGNVFRDKGDDTKAKRLYCRALVILEKSLGPNHPSVALALINIGTIFFEHHEYMRAMEYYRKSLSINEKALDSEHPNIVYSLNGIGRVLLAKRMFREAVAPLERAFDICKKKYCESAPLSSSLFGLARALVAAGGDKKRAIKLAKQAREILAKAPKALEKELLKVDEWLNKHDQSRSESISTATR